MKKEELIAKYQSLIDQNKRLFDGYKNNLKAIDKKHDEFRTQADFEAVHGRRIATNQNLAKITQAVMSQQISFIEDLKTLE
jgi:vacuolar-type H+-ATPase subunit D/Vma8